MKIMIEGTLSNNNNCAGCPAFSTNYNDNGIVWTECTIDLGIPEQVDEYMGDAYRSKECIEKFGAE
jgi:hypothetical protein